MEAGKRWVAGAVLGVVASLVLMPLPAHAAVTFSASCTPAIVSYPGTTNLTCSLQVVTGSQEERFSVGAGAPRFGAGTGRPELPTLQQLGGPTLNGPGSLGGGSGTIASIAQCTSLRGRPMHGASGGSFQRDVTIPPNSTSSLIVPFVAYEPPWPSDSLAPSFYLSNKMSPPIMSTLPGPLVIPTSEPQRTGVSGVQIRFQTKPASSDRFLFGTPQSEIKGGRRVPISGTTSPALNRQVLRIFTQRFGELKSTGIKALAKVRTNRRGHFSYKRWRPDKLGLYEVGVAYRSQRPFLADDFACSRGFTLVK